MKAEGLAPESADPLARWLRVHVRGRDVLDVERLELGQVEAGELPVADASFDTVLLHGVLDRLDDPGPALAEAVRVLRPGGCALITVADGSKTAVDLLAAVLDSLRPTHVELVDGHLALVAVAPPEGFERELREAVEEQARLASLLAAEREAAAELAAQLRVGQDRASSLRPASLLRRLGRRARRALGPAPSAPMPAKFRTLSGRAALALREGRHGLAERLATEALALEPEDPRATFVAAAARWEQNQAGATEEITVLTGPGATDAELEAGVRFFRHIEELPRSFELLRRIRDPRPSLVRELARALGSRGHSELALEASTFALELEPGRPDMVEILDRAKDTLGVLAGDPSGRPAPATSGLIDPVPGRVIHLVQRSLPHHVSGGTVRTQNLIAAQLRAGIDAHATTQVGFPWNSGIGEFGHREVVDGVPYHHRPPVNGDRRLLSAELDQNFDAACELTESLRPSVLHPASDYVNALVALRLRERYGIPVVYEVRGFPEERLARRDGFRALRDHNVARRRLELRCWNEADRLVTLCNAMKAHIVSRGVPAEKVWVIPNAADPAEFRPRERDAALAAELGIGEDEVVLGYVSTLNSYEGLEFLIEATGELAERGHPVRALVVGGGPSLRALFALTRERGLLDRVTFTGRVDHAKVKSMYSLIDVFVVPRRLEATSDLVTPLKPFEAMASGIPVVVSGTTALREIVRDGELGLTFEPESATSLADAVEPLIEDPAARQELAERGREWIRAERTWDHNAELYRSLYEEVTASA